jgi:hypothetical protein
MPDAELICAEALGRGLVGNVMVRPTPNEQDIPWRHFNRRVRVVEPQPGASLDDGVDRKLDRA